MYRAFELRSSRGFTAQDRMLLTVIVLPSGRPPARDWLPDIRRILGPDVPVLLPGAAGPTAANSAARHLVSRIPSLVGTHALVLRSGDLLHPAPLNAALKLLGDEQSVSRVVLGAFALRESPESSPGTVREMLVFEGTLSVADFLLAEIDRPFAVPMSGIILSVPLVKRSEALLNRHSASPWFATMLLTLPGTDRILQPPEPIVTTDMPRDHRSSRIVDVIARAEYFITQALISGDRLVADRLRAEAAALIAANARPARLAAAMAKMAYWHGPGEAAGIARRVIREMSARARFWRTGDRT